MMKSFYLTITLLSSIHLYTNAQSGYLDLSFGIDGITIPELGTPNAEIIHDASLQADGKILLTGAASNDISIMRLMSDGTPDISFGTNGVVLKDFNGGYDRGYDAEVLPDGRIVIAAQVYQNNNADFAILKLMPDGTPDSSFGIHGWAVTDLGTDFEFPNCLAIQSDGKIVIAGRRRDPIFSEFAMVRYHPDGKVDSLFGNDGIVATDIRDEDEATAIVIEPDGQIILAGYASVTASGDFALTRYNSDGTLDKFFGEGGKVLTDLEGFNSSDFIRDMVLLPDGKILVAGNANNNNFEGTSDLGMVRYDANGIQDPDFGTGGIYIESLGTSTDINAMAVQPDGKILVGGSSDISGNENKWVLARYHANGTPDVGFGESGVTTTDLPGTNGTALSLLIQPDSRILMAGYSGINFEADYTAVRYIADFVLIPTVTAITCPGANDASITIEASGGVAPYGYSIDGVEFQSENTFTGLSAGTYTITIRDSNGPGTLGSIGPIVISEPVIPEVDITIIENDITIIVESGGTTPYQYSIDGGNTFTSTNTFTDLNDGAYFILVLDGNGCQVIYRVVLIDITATHDPVESLAFTISPNPTNGQVRLEMNNASGEPLLMRIMDMTGRIVFLTTISETSQVIRKFDFKDFDSGIYQVWVGNEKISGVKKVVIAR